MPDESKNPSQQNLKVSRLSVTALGFVFVLMITYMVSILLGYVPLVFGGFIIIAIFIIFILSLIDLLKRNRNIFIPIDTEDEFKESNIHL
ncbi:MAG TPA: hypothetical protein VIO64_17255 [Pseudobacteroides sp.]|uniref:hypothetical protein n=1 Tax=Pseudobacteroides sp. TaxID=1968840 RepID=UPI002F9473E7